MNFSHRMIGEGTMKTRTPMLLAVITSMALALPGTIRAEDGQQPALHIAVDCMKATAADYTSLETEIWQPMHQELVKQGKQESWALYWVQYGDRSKCDFYTVTSYRGEQQLNSEPSFAAAFAAVHPDDDFAAAMARTWAARAHVATELWVMVDSTVIKPHRFAVVNTMFARDPDAYERMETRVFKPGHQALLDGGYRSGWAMYALVTPLGTSMPYNYSTVDFSNRLDPVPMADAMLTANEGRDLEEMQALLQLRENYSSETWLLIAATTPATGGD
jgi:osmotically-inducible protein OsmY